MHSWCALPALTQFAKLAVPNRLRTWSSGQPKTANPSHPLMLDSHQIGFDGFRSVGFRSVGRLTDANSATLTWCVNTLKTLRQPSGTALGKCSAQTPKAARWRKWLTITKLQPIASLAMHVLGVFLHCFWSAEFFCPSSDSLIKYASKI